MSHNFLVLGHYWNNEIVKFESQITSLKNSLFRKMPLLRIKCYLWVEFQLVEIFLLDSRMKRRAELSTDPHLMETGSDCRRRCQKDLRNLN